MAVILEISGKPKFISELESVPLISFRVFKFSFSINFTVGGLWAGGWGGAVVGQLMLVFSQDPFGCNFTTQVIFLTHS